MKKKKVDESARVEAKREQEFTSFENTRVSGISRVTAGGQTRA